MAATVIVALDLPTRTRALALVDRLGEAVSFYKVGIQLFTHDGPRLVRDLRDRGKRVFLDLKYHDIPNTVAHGVEAAAHLGVSMLSVHASGGSAMMRAAREATGDDGPQLLGVTLLTSFGPADVEEVWSKQLFSLRDEVSRLAGLAAEAGLHGVVASALEAEALKRKHGPDFIVATPGIRPSPQKGEDPVVLAGDQVRTATPGEAARAGSDYVILGRPVVQAKDPLAVVRRVTEEIAVESQ